jgi:sterol desaturase/sphingolipid hydroxylase (fatty acid hydroxylase superfamily)
MQEHVLAVLASVSSFAMIALFFYGVSLLLPKPEGKTENLRNFHCAHDPALFNKEAKCEIFYPLISALLTQPLLFVSIYVLHAVLSEALPYQVLDTHIENWPIILQVLLGLLVIDVSLWIRHSFVHKHFWSFHAVHHSATELSWLTTKRLHPLDNFVMNIIDFGVLYLIGFSAEGMALALIIKKLNNLFVHSNIVLDYPKPWKYIFVSPNMHRWHHATEKDAHDTNYCVVFAFVDYLLGTYYVPDNALPKAYGCGHPELDDIDTKNIVKELWFPFTMGRPASQAEQVVQGCQGSGASPASAASS